MERVGIILLAPDTYFLCIMELTEHTYKFGDHFYGNSQEISKSYREKIKIENI